MALIMHVRVHGGPLLSRSPSWDAAEAQRKADRNEGLVMALTHPERAVIAGR